MKRVELRFNRFLGIAELLLDDALELAPGFLRLSLDQIPLAFGLIPVHVILLSSLPVGCRRFTFDDDLDTAVVGAPLG